MTNTPTTDDVEIDKILITFAKRIDNMERGKTYGWEDEKQSILALKAKWEMEAVKQMQDIPQGLYRANRYDTDDMHTIHLWNDELEGESFDMIIPKAQLTPKQKEEE